MTEAQHAALAWAIELAQIKATAASWQARKSRTAYGADLQRKVASEMQSHANALKAFQDGAHG